MKTIMYGACDPLVVKKLDEILDIKCNIHSIENLDKDYSNLGLIRDNFNREPLLDVEARKIYQDFFNENFVKFNAMIVRRGHLLSDFHDLRDEFSLYFYSFYEILKKNKIELAIFFSFPHEGPDYILYKLAKYFKIKTILFYQTIFKERFFILSDLCEFGKIKKNIERENYHYLLNDDQSYIKTVNDKNQKDRKNSESFIYNLKNSRRKIRFLLLKFFTFLKVINRRDRQKEYLENLEKIQVSNEDLNKIFKNGRKKIYFPLHFQPELTTSLLAHNDDQQLILERLSQFAGEEWDIIVKENPKQTYYQRGKFFFKRLKYFNNVYFVDKFYSSAELVKQTDLIATNCGTPGWESIKSGKKTLVFGTSWFSDIHGCFKVNNQTTDDEIKKFIQQEFDPSKFSSDFNNLMSQSCHGLIDLRYKEFHGIKNFDEKRNAEKIVDHILKFLKKLN